MYVLFLDDERPCPVDVWVCVRSSKEAIDYVAANGYPNALMLDHDLGGDDTSMVFLRWFCDTFFDAGPPIYSVHSANPVGRQNIIAYMESWRRAVAGV